VGTAGINFEFTGLDQVGGGMGARVQELVLDVETKTKDNLFVSADLFRS
jgi:hypothetical protein